MDNSQHIMNTSSNSLASTSVSTVSVCEDDVDDESFEYSWAVDKFNSRKGKLCSPEFFGGPISKHKWKLEFVPEKVIVGTTTGSGAGAVESDGENISVLLYLVEKGENTPSNGIYAKVKCFISINSDLSIRKSSNVKFVNNQQYIEWRWNKKEILPRLTTSGNENERSLKILCKVVLVNNFEILSPSQFQSPKLVKKRGPGRPRNDGTPLKSMRLSNPSSTEPNTSSIRISMQNKTRPNTDSSSCDTDDAENKSVQVKVENGKGEMDGIENANTLLAIKNLRPRRTLGRPEKFIKTNAGLMNGIENENENRVQGPKISYINKRICISNTVRRTSNRVAGVKNDQDQNQTKKEDLKCAGGKTAVLSSILKKNKRMYVKVKSSNYRKVYSTRGFQSKVGKGKPKNYVLKKWGRPRKNPLSQNQNIEKFRTREVGHGPRKKVGRPKKDVKKSNRGRPRKNPLPTQTQNQNKSRDALPEKARQPAAAENVENGNEGYVIMSEDEDFNVGLLLFEDKEFMDFDFVFGDKVQVVKAHKAVLACQSEYFLEICKKVDRITFSSEVKPEIFKLILDYMYKGEIEVKDYENMLEIFSLALKFRLNDLNKMCIDHIIKHKFRKFTPENAIKLLKMVAQVPDSSEALDIILKSIKPIYAEVKKLDKWKEFVINPKFAMVIQRLVYILDI